MFAGAFPEPNSGPTSSHHILDRRSSNVARNLVLSRRGALRRGPISFRGTPSSLGSRGVNTSGFRLCANISVLHFIGFLLRLILADRSPELCRKQSHCQPGGASTTM